MSAEITPERIAEIRAACLRLGIDLGDVHSPQSIHQQRPEGDLPMGIFDVPMEDRDCFSCNHGLSATCPVFRTASHPFHERCSMFVLHDLIKELRMKKQEARKNRWYRRLWRFVMHRCKVATAASQTDIVEV